MFIIIRKNNTILSPEPTEMDTYITGDASCGYKSLGVGTLLYVFNSRCLCNRTIISSVGPWVQIYKSEETFSKRTLWLSFSDWGLTFASFLPQNPSSWVLVRRKQKHSSRCWLIVKPSNPSPVNLWTLSPWFILSSELRARVGQEPHLLHDNVK